MFAVTPKEKFRFRITCNPSERESLDATLIYCGGYDIRCSVGLKCNWQTVNIVEDNFLIASHCFTISHSSFKRVLGFKLNIAIRRMNHFESFVEPQISLKANELPTPSQDVYNIICFDENGAEQKLSCPKYVVAKCGECLVRHFENALNAEKTLVIKDFGAKTVTNFFFCIENQALHYSDVTLDLAKMAHLYHVPSLFRACEKFLSETLKMNSEEFIENVETWIQFANTYNSVLFTSLISSWAERRAENNMLPANWETIVTNNQSFANLVGKLRLGLYKCPPPTKYVVIQPNSIYLICNDM